MKTNWSDTLVSPFHGGDTGSTPVRDANYFNHWNSRQDFLNWVRSDAFVKGHAQSGTLPKDAYFKTNVLELHEVLQDSSRPDLAAEPRGGPFNMH